MRTDIRHCLAVLTHVDRSVTQISFSDTFRINEWPAWRAVAVLAKLEFLAEHEVEARLQGKFRCITPDRTVYILEGDVQLPYHGPDATEQEQDASASAEQELLQRIERYIEQMKLFKDSSVDLALFYLFKGQETLPEFTFSQARTNFSEPLTAETLFALSSEELTAFSSFQKSVQLPFAHEYLQLAYENFLQSYETDDVKLKFLVLMIALEVLFNDGPQELRYRISRGVAVLLSSTRMAGETLFNTTKALYDMRSHLVHTGVAKGLDFVRVAELRSLVRQALVKLHLTNLPKDKLTALLTASGFGEVSRTS